MIKKIEGHQQETNNQIFGKEHRQVTIQMCYPSLYLSFLVTHIEPYIYRCEYKIHIRLFCLTSIVFIILYLYSLWIDLRKRKEKIDRQQLGDTKIDREFSYKKTKALVFISYYPRKAL